MEEDTEPIDKFLSETETRFELLRYIMDKKLERISKGTEEDTERKLSQLLFETTDHDFVIDRRGLYMTMTRVRASKVSAYKSSYTLACEPEILEDQKFTAVNDQFKHTRTDIVCANWSCPEVPTTFSVFTNEPAGSPRVSLVLSVPRCENEACRQRISMQAIRFFRQVLDKNQMIYSGIQEIVYALSRHLPELYHYSRNLALMVDEKAQFSSMLFA